MSLLVSWGHKAHLCPAQQEGRLRAFYVASGGFLEEVGLEEGGVGWEDGMGWGEGGLWRRGSRGRGEAVVGSGLAGRWQTVGGQATVDKGLWGLLSWTRKAQGEGRGDKGWGMIGGL